jgi:hypothetical protein
MLGAEAPSVATSRDAALRRVATAVGMGRDEQLDEVRARLAELPAEQWLGGPVAPNGYASTPHQRPARAAPPRKPREPAAQPAAPEPRRRGIPPWLLGVLALVAVAAITILATGGGSSTTSSDDAQQPSNPPAPAPTPAPATPQPAKPKPAPVQLTSIGGSTRGTARLVSGGRRIRLKLRNLPERSGGSYAVWLYNNVIDARALGAARASRIDLDAKLPSNWRRYRYIDVSFEPTDNNPSHSGESVARVPTRELR